MFFHLRAIQQREVNVLNHQSAASRVDALLDRITIVMVETTHTGNIGAAARAMKNMGLKHLTLVSPYTGIDHVAIRRAAGAKDILERATVVDTLGDAIADCQWVVGTSARSRHIPWPLMSARTCGQEVQQAAQAGNNIAIVFGRESRGLTNDELHQCHAHVHIDTDEEYSSLNVAQAVQVLSYEARQAVLEAGVASDEQQMPWGVEWDHPLATHDELNGMLSHLEQTLVSLEFLDPENPMQLMTRLRRLYQRAALDKTEVNMVRGMLAAMQKRL